MVRLEMVKRMRAICVNETCAPSDQYLHRLDPSMATSGVRLAYRTGVNARDGSSNGVNSKAGSARSNDISRLSICACAPELMRRQQADPQHDVWNQHALIAHFGQLVDRISVDGCLFIRAARL